MTPELKALCERLRAFASTAWAVNQGVDWAGSEAASAIEAMGAEVERLKNHYKGVPHDWVAQTLHDEVMAENESLRLQAEALAKQYVDMKAYADATRLQVEALAKDAERWRMADSLRQVSASEIDAAIRGAK